MIKGKCALCGKVDILTYEHIPPRSAFNDVRSKVISGDTYMGNIQKGDKAEPLAKLRYENAQRGKGDYSLCGNCNSITGRWYGEDYSKFAHGISNLIIQLNIQKGMTLEVTKAVIKPLNILKQIISMFCSVNRAFDNEGMEKLRAFVLDKYSHELGNFRIGMFLFINGVERTCPFMRLGNVFESNQFINISEIISYPFGFALIEGMAPSYPYGVTDITSFKNFDYDEEITTKMDISAYETNDMLPGIVLKEA